MSKLAFGHFAHAQSDPQAWAVMQSNSIREFPLVKPDADAVRLQPLSERADDGFLLGAMAEKDVEDYLVLQPPDCLPFNPLADARRLCYGPHMWL